MDIRMIFEIVIFVFCGACIAYLKTNATIKEKIVEFIGKAEEEYKDVTDSNGLKFQYVVNKIYEYIPKSIKPFFPKSSVENLVQKIFDFIKIYSKTKLDEFVEKEVNNKNEN